MTSYRLLQNRRHVFQLRDGNAIVAEMAMHDGRANVTTKSTRYVLEAIDGVRRRVVMISERNHTVVRPSTLAQYAIDLESMSLYWRSLPGRVYCWITNEEKIAIRYAPVDDGSWDVNVYFDAPLSATIAGAFLILRSALEMAPQPRPSVAARP
jgi:hypothetical protein